MFNNMSGHQKHTKTHILFLLPGLDSGGAERVTVKLMTNLSLGEEFSPSLATLNREGPLVEIIPANIPVHDVAGNSSAVKSFFNLWRLWKKEKPEIVFSTLTMMNFLACSVAVFFPKIKLIVREATLPSYFFQTYPAYAWIIRLAYQVLYRRANIVIAPSAPVLKELQDIMGPNGCRLEMLYNPVKSPIKTTMKKNTGKTVFLSVGRLNFQKGLDTLIGSLENTSMPYDWKWIIVGDGPQKEELSDLIKMRGLTDRIDLAGYHKSPEKFYDEADALLLPSRWEGMPNVALEALSYGIPVLSLQTAGGVTEIAELSPPNTVLVTKDAAALVQTMAEKKWEREYRNLLPDIFLEEHVFQSFTDILRRA